MKTQMISGALTAANPGVASPTPVPVELPEPRPRLIVCAALRDDSTGLVFALPQPGRHSDIIHAMVQAGIAPPIDRGRFEQGFLDSEGRFAWRSRAKLIAADAGQLLPRAGASHELFSEDVW